MNVVKVAVDEADAGRPLRVTTWAQAGVDVGARVVGGSVSASVTFSIAVFTTAVTFFKERTRANPELNISTRRSSSHR